MKRNFTLLEMVVASAIILLLVSALSLSVHGVYGSWRRVVRANKRLEEFLTMDRICDIAFRNAVPFTWLDKNGKERFIFKGDSSELLITYIHRINNPADGAINFLRLYRENNNLVAEYRKTPILWWENDERNLTKEIILTGVSSISFQYADIVNDEFILTDDWDEDTALNIPLGIQIKVNFNDGTSEQWFRRTAGAGLRETFGARRLSR